MWDENLLEMLGPFLGKTVTTDTYTVSKQYRGYVDEALYEPGSGTIDVCLVSKHGTTGEERNWTYEHVVSIAMEGYMITSFTIDDRVYGGDALGDYDPSLVFSEKSYFHAAVQFVKKITK